MLRNQKAFTLIEILAVLVVSTAVLFPLLNALIGNYEVNTRMHTRRAASSLAVTTVEGFNKVYYTDLEALIAASVNNFVEISASDCEDPNLFDDVVYDNVTFNRIRSSAEVCSMLFAQTWSNITFGEEEFKIYVYSYALSEADKDAVLARTDLPQRVRDEVAILPALTASTSADVLRITTWIQYDSDNNGDIVASGVINRD